MGTRVPIYSAASEMQAEFLAQLLESHGIEAVTAGGTLTTLAGYLPATYARARVMVDATDAEAARAIVRDFERARKHPKEEPPTGETWVCANCGEVLELQFTDCWKCQTPRPRDEDKAAPDAKTRATAQRGAADQQIPVDLPCVRCQYNLRNLAVDKLCPECAHPALSSLFQAMQSQPEWSLEHGPALTPCLDFVEAMTGHPIEAIVFVMRMWRRAERKARFAIGERPDDDDMALALRDEAVRFLGDPVTASRALQRWRLGDGADVARIRAVIDRYALID